MSGCLCALGAHHACISPKRCGCPVTTGRHGWPPLRPEPAVLLRDTPEDRERLAAALTSVEWHRWKSERVDDIHTRNLSNAIIAALRGKGNAGFYDDPNAEGNDR